MEGFRVADRQVGGGNLYPAVIGYLRTTIAPRLFDIATDSTDRAIFTSASAMSEMAGWMAHDAGNHANARTHFRRSLELAELGRDFQLTAHILASLSHLSLHGREPEKAIQLAQEGRANLAAAPDNPGLAARLFSMEARGYAGLRVPNDYKCNENLELAAQALERHAPEQGSPWVSKFDDGSLSSEAARCMRQLSRFAEAEYHARRIITLRSGDRTRSRAFGQLLLVGALIAQGVPEEACGIAREVLEATHSLNSYLVLEQLNSVRANLAPFKSNKVVSTFRSELGEGLRARMAIYQIGDSSTIKENQA
jgi:tetratricopeptide (TPR) repeat protein